MLTKAPKGTKDLLPGESYEWQYIEAMIRRICADANYFEIRTPIFEHTELFLRSVGDTTDVVQKEMYTFEDKGHRSITLRPEGTAGVVRAFIESGLCAGPQPTKLYYLSAPVFRYENPQAGRLRQHHQFGVEVFGAKDASIDAEVITLALSVIRGLGIQNLQLNINSIGCPNCRPAYQKELIAYFEAHKDALCPTCQERLYKNPLRILDCKVDKCKEIAKGAPLMIDHLCEECSTHFALLQEYLKAVGVSYQINPFIVRGLDYYTKTVFEIISEEIGAQGTVCGGGRYDGLVRQIGGPELCGIGFGMGIERLLLVAKSAGAVIPKPAPLRVFFAAMGQRARIQAFSFVAELKKAGISADMDHSARSLKAQFKFADKLGAQEVVVLGEDELTSGIVKVRNMKDGGEEKIPLKELIEWIKGEQRA